MRIVPAYWTALSLWLALSTVAGAAFQAGPSSDWWRYFGWPWLGAPPSGDPSHSQDFTFDYGPLHVIGLEAYINNGSYDHYRQDIWGAQSFTPEQMAWLQSDIAAQPPGSSAEAVEHQ